MQIQEIDVQNWQQAVDTYSRNNFFQQAAWLNLVSSEFGLVNRYLKATVNGSELFLSFQIKDSIGYSNFIGYGGPICSTPLTLESLADLIVSIENQIKIRIRRMKLFPGDIDNSPIGANWSLEHASILKINPGWEDRLPKPTRYSIKQAVKNYVEVRQIDQNDLHRFYEIYSETMERVKSSYKTPESLFQRLFEFPNVDFMGAFVAGKLEATCIFLNQGEWSYYWWSASTLTGRKYNTNYLILFSEIKKLQQHGVRILDMASSNNQGVSKFKTQWGAELKPFWFYENIG